MGRVLALAVFGLLLVSSTVGRARAAEPATWLTDRGTVRFHADSPMQAIDAKSTVATFVYDGRGAFVGSVAMSSFEFTNGLLKKHFNESYAESERPGPADARGEATYPYRLAVVSGHLVTPLDVSRDGTTEVSLKGRFTCHGVSQARVFRGTVTVAGGEMTLDVRFDVSPKDHGIPLPTIGDAPMFQSVEVGVSGTLLRASSASP